MLIEQEEIALADLLKLALGGGAGEIGAVNFNYLHDFLYGLIKQLGISQNTTVFNHEEVISRSGSQDGIHNILSSKTSLAWRGSKNSRPVKTSSNTGEGALNSGNEKEQQDPQNQEEVRSQSQTAGAEQNEPNQNVNQGDASKRDESQGKEIESQNQNEDHQQNKKREESPSNRSQNIDDTYRRRSSLGNKRSIKGSVQYGTSSRGSMRGSQMMDLAELDSKLESGEGLTKAGEMWHVMNINRRVETAEAGIEGLNSMIDTLKEAVFDIKSQAEEKEEELERKLQENLKKYGGVDGNDKSIVKSNVSNDANKSSSDIDSKIAKLATKDEIKPFCNIAQVKEMIDKNLRAYSAANSQTASVKKEGNESDSNDSASNYAEENRRAVLEFETNIEQKIQGLSDEVGTLKNDLDILNDNSKCIPKLQDDMNTVQNHINNTTTVLPSSPLQTVKPKIDTSPDVNLIIEPIRINFKKLTETVNGLNTDIDSVRETLNGLNESSKVTKKDVTELVDRNNTFSEAQKNMANKLNNLNRDIEETKLNIHSAQNGTLQRKSSNIDEEGALSKLRGTLYDLEEKQVAYQNEIDSLSQAERKLENELKDVNTKIGNLETNKTDKKFVMGQIESKAEKKDLKNIVKRSQFDDCIMGIDRNIQNLAQDLQSTEVKSTKAFNNLQEALEDKLNGEDAMEIRSYIDSRFKTFKPKMPPVQPAEDYAAGSRKKLVPDCNCISCDRPVGVPCDAQCPALPYFNALPGMKSIRPVTTFELQTIRQHMQPGIPGNKERFFISETREKLQKELLQLCNAQDLDEIGLETSNRPCGGVHTLGQHRKSYGRPPMFYREDYSQFQTADIQKKERDVIGKDGHIYKGRASDATSLPDVHSNEMMTRGSKTSLRSNSPKKEAVVTVLPSIETSS